MSHAELLDAVEAALRSAPVGARALLSAAIRDRMFGVLHDMRVTRRQRWDTPGQMLRGAFIPGGVDPDSAAVRTEHGDVVTFSTASKDLAAKLAGVPAGAHVEIVYERLAIPRKLFRVAVT